MKNKTGKRESGKTETKTRNENEKTRKISWQKVLLLLLLLEVTGAFSGKISRGNLKLNSSIDANGNAKELSEISRKGTRA